MTEIRSETPGLTDVISESIDSKLYEMNTCMPGIVVAYNPATNMAEVQPAFTRKYLTNPVPLPLPTIPNVPVVQPRSNIAAMTFPMKTGDGVLLLFSQRSLEAWKGQGGIVPIPPGNTRRHDLSDAVAIPGMYSTALPTTVDPLNLVISHGPSKLNLSPTGAIEIKAGAATISMNPLGKISIGNGVIELLDLIDKLIDELLVATWATNTGATTAPPVNAAKFAAIKTQLALIKD